MKGKPLQNATDPPLVIWAYRIRLVGSNQLDKAAIFDAQGSSVWASSPGFQVCNEQ